MHAKLHLYLVFGMNYHRIPWVKYYRIIPEFRRLRRLSSIKILNYADYDHDHSFIYIFSLLPNTTGHLPLITAMFVIKISHVMYLERTFI